MRWPRRAACFRRRFHAYPRSSAMKAKATVQMKITCLLQSPRHAAPWQRPGARASWPRLPQPERRMTAWSPVALAEERLGAVARTAETAENQGVAAPVEAVEAVGREAVEARVRRAWREGHGNPTRLGTLLSAGTRLRSHP
eukprot:6653724-Prymnesium_polylepis.2